MKYYYARNEERFGPYTIDELHDHKLRPETLVWADGLPQWVQAKDVPDLSVLFGAPVPPPIPSHFSTKKAPNYTLPIVGAVLVVVVAVFILLNNARKRDRPLDGTAFLPTTSSMTPAEEREDLGHKEKRLPLDYLTVSFANWSNLISQEVIEGDVSNTASVATYKDVRLRVDFLAKSGTILDQQYITIYDVISPGSKLHFKHKFSSYPQQTGSVNVVVARAVGR